MGGSEEVLELERLNQHSEDGHSRGVLEVNQGPDVITKKKGLWGLVAVSEPVDLAESILYHKRLLLKA